MQTLIVTGGAGYIGSIVTRKLLDSGYRVVVLDNLCTGHRWAVDERAAFFEGDIADSRLLQKIKELHEPSGVFHFAALSQVSESVAKPDLYFKNNFEKAKVLIDFCVQNKISKFIFSSTAAVYGEPKKIPISEEDPCLPINPYGESKLKVENYLRTLQNQNGFQFLIFRYFNVAGAWPDGSLGEAHDPETHLIPRVLLDALSETSRPKISIFGTDYSTPDGTCVRDYLHVVDIASAHIRGFEKMDGFSGEVFNLGSASGFSVQQVASAVEKVLDLKLEVTRAPRRSGDPAVLVAESRKARDVLGWVPEYDNLETMISHAWQWLKSGANRASKNTFPKRTAI